MNQSSTKMPVKVENALFLLYSTFAIGFIRIIIMGYSQVSPHESFGSRIFSAVLVFVILGFFYNQIGHRKNWARITILVLFILGTPFGIIGEWLIFASSPISGVLGLIQVVMQIVALVFLFEKQSSDWFRLTDVNQ